MSAAIFNSESEHCSSELDLFSAPAHQLAIESYFNTPVLPSHPLSNQSNTIVFECPLSHEYTSLSESQLQVRLRIRQQDDTNLPAFVGNTQAAPTQSNSVAIINGALNSIFSGVEVKLNGISVNPNFYTNGFCSYIQNLLSYGKECLESKMALQGWYQDHNFTLSRGDDAESANNKKSGYYIRAQKTKLSHVWTLIGNLHNPICQESRLMLPLMPIEILLTKARTEFVLQSNKSEPNFKLEILDAKINLRRVKVLSSYKLRLEASLQSADAIYPVRTFECRPYSLDANIRSYTYNNIFPQNSCLPEFACVMLVKSQCFTGDISTSPYHFQAFGLEEISISFDQYHFTHHCEFQNESELDYTEPYNALFQASGMKSNSGLSFKLEDFPKNAIYCYDFGREEALNCEQWNGTRAGSARLNLRFNANVANEALTVLVYSEYNSVIKISKNREVSRLYNI